MYKSNKDIMKSLVMSTFKKIIKQIEYKKGVNFIMEKLTNEECCQIFKQCEGKTEEEIRDILRTTKGKMLVQDFFMTEFPKTQSNPNIEKKQHN